MYSRDISHYQGELTAPAEEKKKKKKKKKKRRRKKKGKGTARAFFHPVRLAAEFARLKPRLHQPAIVASCVDSFVSALAMGVIDNSITSGVVMQFVRFCLIGIA